MATCDLCNHDMTTGASCVIDSLHQEGRAFPLAIHPRGRDRPCGDCGVDPGGLHHLGCDVQRCPDCRGQLISCDCPWDEFAAERALDEELLDDDSPDESNVVPFPPSSGPVGPPIQLVPFSAAAAPCRAKHHPILAELAEWSLAAGRPIDLDVAAVLLEQIAGGWWRDGPFQRPHVMHVLSCDIRNWCSLARTLQPEDVPVHFWTLLGWLSETDRLPVGSDPLDALREPLRCYCGLGADGQPLPPGSLREIPCQCFVAHDPSVPDGMIRRIIGSREGNDFIAVVHPPDERLDKFAEHGPLLRLSARLRKEDLVPDFEPTEWGYAGRSDASGKTPALWYYQHKRDRSIGYDFLALSHEGEVHCLVPDRRRKAGYRFKPGRDFSVVGYFARAWRSEEDYAEGW